MNFSLRAALRSPSRSSSFHGIGLAIVLLGCGDGASPGAREVREPDGPGATGDDASVPGVADGENGTGGRNVADASLDASAGAAGEAPGTEPTLEDASFAGTGGSGATPPDAGGGVGPASDVEGGPPGMDAEVDTPDADASPPESNGLDETRAGGPCPEAPPTPNSPCESRYAFCSYGEGPSAGCRQRFTCQATDQWVGASAPGGSCVQPGSVCETMPEGSCDQVGQTCSFGDSICSCNPEQTESCGGDGCHPLEAPIPQQWACSVLRVQEGCPELPPNAGTQCDGSLFSCLYGEQCTGVYVGCVDGYIEWEEALCP